MAHTFLPPVSLNNIRHAYQSHSFRCVTGWHRTAMINTFLLASITAFFIAVLVASSFPADGLRKAIKIYTGDCNGGSATRVSQTLHFLTNALSTAILGSSNCFMQVLNAPTRDEIDACHKDGFHLDIGVPSLRNVFHVSRFKSGAWVVLLITSISIHFIFNSAVFDIEYRGAFYNLTIASEDFTNGAPYFLPGASPFSNERDIATSDDIWYLYSSDLSMSSAVSKVSQHGAEWTKLKKADCVKQYVQGHGLQQYGDVIIVVQSPAGGWNRSETWNATIEVIDRWAQYTPRNQHNSLWFSANCSMTANIQYYGGLATTHSCW
ncbi:hypothetical protein F4678DRAFT_445125 [Xylaria arbuscula]|nr:hypothetical protein F4678DRAFT_445125 [Xylaria arbuscula]